jgi:hypothetical protein
MAIRLERAHAEIVGEHEGLLGKGSCGLAPRRIAPHRDVAEEPHSLRLTAMSLVPAGLRPRLLSTGLRPLVCVGGVCDR